VLRTENGIPPVSYTHLDVYKRQAYYPTVTLSASAGLETTSFTKWFTWPSRFWSVGPSATETLFDGGLRRATVQQFQANFLETIANYRQTVLAAFQNVEDNLAALRILSIEIKQQDTAVGLSLIHIFRSFGKVLRP